MIVGAKDHSGAGYTLAESLAALMMIGLAIGGLTVGAQTVGRIQSSASGAVAGDRAQAQAGKLLARLFEGQGPFRPDLAPALNGEARRLSFACQAARDCVAELRDEGGDVRLTVTGGGGVARSVRLPGARGAHFVYADAAGPLDAWPAPAGEPRRLKSVAVVRGGQDDAESIVAVALWKEQAAVCRYDMILQDCRGGEG